AILDEAKKLGMKVWILDDAHFPTGYANGAVESADVSLCRQSICASTDGTFPPAFKPNFMEQYIHDNYGEQKQRHFDDDKIISVTKTGDITWTIGLSRNCGPHRNYINMMNKKSVRLLIDAVYEKHWEHYRGEFGKTIAGFFSDEPELGNRYLYDQQCKLGTDNDFPFSDELAVELRQSLGDDWASQMYLLWENNAPRSDIARVRYTYMDAVTRLVRDNFSYQIGDWCREHGVEYIGHSLEDGGTHARLASGLGHYFRGLEGQDYAGIDDIGGQVYPQGEDDTSSDILGRKRDADFYHFLLGRLASSAANIEKQKNGRAMCEIFGNYGWAEGVRLEKYLVDHFMVRGVNYFVPHAFSPKAFPDPDCPPHFYAHGHNPQYRHFGELMGYVNRVCTLISGGKREVKTALLYDAELEWIGGNLQCEKTARILEEHQIDFDVVPLDYFHFPEKYNDNHYDTLIIPDSGLYRKLCETGIRTILYDEVSKFIDDLQAVSFMPYDRHLRVSHIKGETDIYYFVNEGKGDYKGEITVPTTGNRVIYNAWDNRLEKSNCVAAENRTKLSVSIEPGKGLIIVFGYSGEAGIRLPVSDDGEEIMLADWTRSVCEGAEYPVFGEAAPVILPDRLAGEMPEFSGFVKYKTKFVAEDSQKYALVIDNASEGVEVFVNGNSAGIQIVPKYRFDISGLVKTGENELVIEVATTLERQCYGHITDPMMKQNTPQPSSEIGITGNVVLLNQGIRR
ncbi:MAG: hypothetical protein LBH85_07510, partial [Treponema sp.]|nr:hypothetical protein [Treponema sp.]